MRRLDVIIEEPSMEEALRSLLLKILQGRARYKLINMRNKCPLGADEGRWP